MPQSLPPTLATQAAPARPPAPPRPSGPARLLALLMSYLPLLLMSLLALATWWLVRNAPGAEPAQGPAVVRQAPDYTMERFATERFDKHGRLLLRVEGEQLRHYPANDRIEVDTVRMRAYSPDGAVTQATARRALANGDLSEVQLLGGARVERSDPKGGPPLQFEGEFLHAFLRTEKLRSHLPVLLRQGGSQVHASGFEYDHLSRVVQFEGPARGRFEPTGRRR